MLCQLALPVVKVGGNDYLIGTTVKKVTLQKGQALVKEASSYLGLKEYIKLCAHEEFKALQQKMRADDLSLEDAVLALLERYGSQRIHK